MAVYFYDIESECATPIYILDNDYRPRPVVGDRVLLSTKVYEVTRVLIDYETNSMYVSLRMRWGD